MTRGLTDYVESDFLLTVISGKEGEAIAMLQEMDDFALNDLRKGLVAARWLIDDEQTLRARKNREQSLREGDNGLVL